MTPPDPDPSHDPSIENEPHLRGNFFSLDPSERKAEELLHQQAERSTQHDAVEHTVWDEPTLNPELAGTPNDQQLTYQRWIAENIASTTWTKSLLVTLAIVLISGPFAVIGALFGSTNLGAASLAQLIVIAVVAPVTEEIMKIAAALWVVEKRPFWFKTIPQILLCALAGGIVFGIIENLMYLYVYIDNPGPSLIRWRWTVCVGLHMTCSFTAGVGLTRIWDNAIRNQHRPILGLGLPWFFTAMVGHGIYNFSVSIAELTGMLKLD